MHALVLAPQGSIVLDSNTVVTGALAVKNVSLGANSDVKYEDGVSGRQAARRLRATTATLAQ